jgi:hypothetical protein
MACHLFDDTHRVGPPSDSGKRDTPTDLAPATPKVPRAAGRHHRPPVVRRTKEIWGDPGGAA